MLILYTERSVAILSTRHILEYLGIKCSVEVIMEKDSLQGQREIATDQERRKLFLRYVNRGWLVFGIVTLITLPIFPEQRSQFIYLAAVTFPSYFIVRILNLSGQTRWAGVVLTVSANFVFYGLFLVLVHDLGAEEAFRTQATVWMLMGLAVLFAGAFVDKWAAPVVAVFNTILLIGTRLTLAPGSEPRPSVMVFWSTLAITIWLYERTLLQAFTRVWNELAERKQTEQALRQSEQRYRLLAENSTDVIWTMDMNLQSTYTSPSVKRMRGFDAEEAMRQSLEEALTPASFDVVRKVLKEELALEKMPEVDLLRSRALELEVIRKDGSTFWVETKMTFLRDPDDKPVEILGVNRDITARKLAEGALYESEEKYRLLFENVMNGFSLHEIVLDVKGRPVDYIFLEVNHAFEQLTGLESENIIGKKATQVIPGIENDSADWIGKYGEVTRTGKEIRFEQHAQAIGKWYSVLAFRPRKGQFATIFEDVTERKQAEHELRRRIDELSALYQTTLDTISAHDLPYLLNTIVMRAVDLLEGTSGGLYLCDLEKEQARCVVSYKTQDDYTGTVLAFGEGAAGTVAATGEPLIIDYYQTWEGRAKAFEVDHPFSAVISAPMLWQGQVTGVIHVLHNTEKHKFTQEDLKLLTSFANQAAVAVENTRLFEETQRRLDRLSSLRRIDQVITSSLDMRVTLNILIGQTLQQLDVDAAAVLLYQTELQSLEFVAGQGFRTRALQSTTLRLGQGFAGRAALEQQMVQVSDLNQLYTGFLRSPEFRNEEFVAYLGVPLIAKGNIIGVLEIYNRQPLDPDREWIAFLETLAGQAAIAVDNINLFNDLQMSNLELIQAHDATIEGWARALELRDMETEGHSRRVVDLTMELARKMGIEEGKLIHVRQGALLHDIGKMGVPDSILQKKGPLTDSEWKTIHQHPLFAHNWLKPISYLQPALDIPYCHHEKWDGTGYPRGLKDEEIPLAARIFTVVDVWDALTSDRPYRSAWTEEKTLEYIREQAGQHFDPAVVDAFMELISSDGTISNGATSSLKDEI